VRFWKMRREVYAGFAAAKPNIGHEALARLEQGGFLRAVITQNIDGLHQDAGSRRVIELHGTARVIACIGCRREWTPEAVIERLDAGDDAPDCEDCGAPLKSKTISFGQAMPLAEMEEARGLAGDADVFLAIGSSLVVEPAAAIPRYAKNCRAKLVILNNEATPLDDRADLVIRAPIGETMRNVLASLGP